MYNREQPVPIADVYEYTLKALEKEEIPEAYLKDVYYNLHGLSYLLKSFKTDNTKWLQGMHDAVVKEIKDETFPVDLLALSCMYYNFTKKGLDTKELRELINEGDYVKDNVRHFLSQDVERHS